MADEIAKCARSSLHGKVQSGKREIGSPVTSQLWTLASRLSGTRLTHKAPYGRSAICTSAVIVHPPPPPSHDVSQALFKNRAKCLVTFAEVCQFFVCENTAWQLPLTAHHLRVLFSTRLHSLKSALFFTMHRNISLLHGLSAMFRTFL